MEQTQSQSRPPWNTERKRSNRTWATKPAMVPVHEGTQLGRDIQLFGSPEDANFFLKKRHYKKLLIKSSQHFSIFQAPRPGS